MIGESHIDAALWDWLALDDDDKELLRVYRAEIDSDGSIEQARDAYAGRYKDEEDWAYEFLTDTGALESIPENLRNYFDFAAYARDARMNGDVSFADHDGETWVFWNR
jgi:antirestriction protein